MTMNATKVEKLAAGVANAMEHLASVLERENAALTEFRPETVVALVREKSTAVRAYEAKIRALRQETADLSALDDQRRRDLRELGEMLAPLANDNERLLRVAIEANRRLLDAFADAVRTLSGEASAYSRRGTVASRGVTAAKRIALSVNQSL
jgi:flagellar biosynthesis/type III secretory pathway chaperone